MKLSRMLYKAARISNNIESFSRPYKAPRRVKNIVVGRTLGKIGFWRRLWQ
jgi:hypothetical protein